MWIMRCFFMRSEVSGESIDKEGLKSSLSLVLPDGSNIFVIDKDTKKNIIIFATKESHALGDIILRAYEK